MTATKTLFNFSDYERTYNFAVDLVAQTVGFHRKNFSPLKAIYLNKKYWTAFRLYMITKVGEEHANRSVFEFDGVDIKPVEQADQFIKYNLSVKKLASAGFFELYPLTQPSKPNSN